MADHTGIEWTDATWNPITGCTKISPGCKNCYAERLALRLRAMGSPRYRNGFAVTLQPDQVDLPLRWRRPEGSPSKTLGLAFIDPEGFEATFSMFRTLARRPIDILLLFPSGIGVRRNLRAFVKQPSSPMDALWGGPEWRDLPLAKQAAGRRLSAAEADTLDRPWIQRFREKMTGIGFEYQDESDPCFRNIRNAPMYHLLFFSRHSAGLQIWKNTKKIEPTGQRPLPGF